MSDSPTAPCPCSETQDPQVVTNPPGLPSISYRVDDFTGFRRALLRPLPGEQAIGNWAQAAGDPSLQNWQPAPGDLGLMVLEWWAYVADVLTFYNERIANESYLGTAQFPSSLANLVALIGYQPAPGLASTGQVAALQSPGQPPQPMTIPTGMRIGSTAAPGVPSQTFEVDAGAVFTPPSNVPVTIPPNTSLQLNADGSPASVLLAGKVSGVKAGDRLVLVATDFDGVDDSWSYVTVASVTPSTDPSTGVVNTLVAFGSTGGWGPFPVPAVPPPPPPPPTPTPSFSFSFSFPSFSFGGFEDFMLRRPATTAKTVAPASAESSIAVDRVSESIGGSSALEGEELEEIGPAYYHWLPGQSFVIPQDVVGPSSSVVTDYRLLKPTQTAALWNASVTAAQPAITSEQEFHLSCAVRTISPGDTVLFDNGVGVGSALGIVASITDGLYTIPYPGAPPPTPPNVVVSHTVLTMTMPTNDFNGMLDIDKTPGQVTVRYNFRDAGTIIPVPATSLDSLSATVYVPASYDVPVGGTNGFLIDSTGAGVYVGVAGAGQTPAGIFPVGNQVTLTAAGNPPSSIGAAALLPPLVLCTDLLPVSRGVTVTNEVLGSGNAALVNQSFQLAKGPLTYLAQGTSWTSTLQVYVGGVSGVLWQEVPSFYLQPPDAQVYVVSRSADQSVTTVTFGDGVNGARLPSGSGNVVAIYRYGSGAASPPAGALTTILQPQLRLTSIKNPVAVLPGKDPQAADDVRANAPASVFTFGRAISAIDYEVVAGQAPGVDRVSAQWVFDGNEQRTLVTVYVGDDAAAVTAATGALAGAEDPNRPVSVVQAVPQTLSLTCTLVISDALQTTPVVTAATAALLDPTVGLFSPSQMGIGQRLYRSAVDAALSVPGVVAVRDLAVTQQFTIDFFFPEYFFGGGGGGGGDVTPITFTLTLDEVFDPGVGGFFVLPALNVNITGVNQ